MIYDAHFIILQARKMPYVSFIDDNTFENIVSDTINVASNA
ncbi:TPA: Eco47II family restriction endonuclease, partial [Legionella pneumophila]|nr:Eco47II family restriction endonuclease [Legionella pneumophila]